MAFRPNFPPIRVSSPGARMNVTTTSSSLTLPLAADGTNPRFCRLIVEPQTTGNGSFCYVHFGQSTAVTCDTTGLCVTSNESTIVSTRGYSYISVFNPSNTANLNVVPLEDA